MAEGVFERGVPEPSRMDRGVVQEEKEGLNGDPKLETNYLKTRWHKEKGKD